VARIRAAARKRWPHLAGRGHSKELMKAVRSWELSVEERDRLGLVWYARVRNNIPWRTIVGSAENRLYLGGEAAGAGRMVSGSEYALAMGIRLNSEEFVEARRTLDDKTLAKAAGQSLSAAFASAHVRASLELWGDRVTSRMVCAEIYSGAFCAYTRAMRRTGMGAEVAFVAESHSGMLSSAARAFNASRSYSSSEEAVEREAGSRVDALFACPPCVYVTPLRYAAGRTWEQRIAETRSKVLHGIQVVLTGIHNLQPAMFLMEQSAGLATHHKDTLVEVHRTLLSTVGYTWWFARVNAIEVGGLAPRDRLAWTAMRNDCIHGEPARGVGTRSINAFCARCGVRRRFLRWSEAWACVDCDMWMSRGKAQLLTDAWGPSGNDTLTRRHP